MSFSNFDDKPVIKKNDFTFSGTSYEDEEDPSMGWGKSAKSTDNCACW